MTLSERIKLIALDFDGTLLETTAGDEAFHPDAIAYLNACAEHGIAWCSSSGRHLKSQLDALEASRARGLEHMPLALIVAESLLYEYRDGEFIPDAAWNEPLETRTRNFQKTVQHCCEPHLEAWLARYPILRHTRDDIYTAFELESEPAAEAFFQVFQAACQDVAGGRLFFNRTWVAALPDGIDKSTGMGRLRERFGFAPEQILAIGDELNDLPMLDGRHAHWVGCPSNANDEVKRLVSTHGGIIADAVAGAGSAQVIRHFVKPLGNLSGLALSQ